MVKKRSKPVLKKKVKNGREWSIRSKTVNMVKTGQKNGQKRSKKIAKWSKKVRKGIKNSQKWSKTVGKRSKTVSTVTNGPKW